MSLSGAPGVYQYEVKMKIKTNIKAGSDDGGAQKTGKPLAPTLLTFKSSLEGSGPPPKAS
jgi:hypothetical protein